jgi:hypothetical protein
MLSAWADWTGAPAKLHYPKRVDYAELSANAGVSAFNKKSGSMPG